MPSIPTDLIIAGGGLAGGLCALAASARRPDWRILLIESGERIGGNHLWSLFDSDVAQAQRWLVEPLTAHRWPGYEVRFPAYTRRIVEPYRTIESERLDAAVRAALPEDAIVRAEVAALEPRAVTLADGTRIEARAVLDARGGRAEGLECGWQKFVGRLLHVPGGHGMTEPVIMDATVDQADGYRFVYLLPFDEQRIFVEDTYYSETPELSVGRLADRIDVYAEARGWRGTSVERSEQGVLPVVIGGRFDRLWPASDGIARAGVRGGFFHPLTSYSLPDAVGFACWLAEEADLDRLGEQSRARARAHWRRGRLDRMLARLLLRAADPPERYRVLERFYRLPGPLIARFYGGTNSVADRIRILAGQPPVPMGRAIRTILEMR